jgi:hypothetical protein
LGVFGVRAPETLGSLLGHDVTRALRKVQENTGQQGSFSKWGQVTGMDVSRETLRWIKSAKGVVWVNTVEG